MLWKIKPSLLHGTLPIPASKSHSIRAIVLACLARGTSTINNITAADDVLSAVKCASGFGAQCRLEAATLSIEGLDAQLNNGTQHIDLGNSGTSMRLFTAAATLGSMPRTFDGDASLRTRKMKSLLKALAGLGASYTIHQSGRDVPFTINGPIAPGETTVDGITSQFLSALLLTVPLLNGRTTVHVVNLYEKPYVDITLWWLRKMGVNIVVDDAFSRFTIDGPYRYQGFVETIPADFSSACFPAAAAVVCGGPLTLQNLDFSDPQGDKEFFTILETMGATVVRNGRNVTVSASTPLRGIDIDLNAMPDSLPILSVIGCFATGTTRLLNVAQARIKETDRIRAMCAELSKMGAIVSELDDGLVIKHSRLRGTAVAGHGDHRIVMALAVAGLVAEGETVIDTAEASAVTYPTFASDFCSVGASIEECEFEDKKE